MERKTSGGQSVKLNRIVVPAHLKVVPLKEDEGPLSASAPAANTESAPAADPRFVKPDDTEPPNPAFRRMIIAASVLAGVIAVLLYTNSRNSSAALDPFADLTPSTDPAIIEAALEATLAQPEPPTAEPAPSAQATVVSLLPQPRPAQPTPIATAPSILSEPVVPNRPAMATAPEKERPIPAIVARAPETEPAPELELNLVELVTTGTLEALRNGTASEEETALYRFVQSLQSRSRPNAEITEMLQRAHNAGTLPVPQRYLNQGRVNLDAILTAMRATE